MSDVPLPGGSSPPAGTATIAKILAVPFGAAARLRHARAVHPRGRTYAATLRVTDTGLADLLGEERHVVVRLSKATATPGGFPDVLGVAFRVPADAGPVDLLLATTGSRPGLRHLLQVRRSFGDAVHTTLLPYSVHGRIRMLALLPATTRRISCDMATLDAAIATGPLPFTLATASLTGPWEPCGTLEIHTPLPDGSPDTDAFDPEINNLPALHPAGPLRRWRLLAYAASRHGRGQPFAVPRPAPRVRPINHWRPYAWK